MSNPTQRTKPPEVFSDFDINFARNPVTGNLAKVTNEEAVKASLRNIICTMQGEWPHDRLLGSRVRKSLFDLPNLITASMIKTSIQQAVKFEPRAQVDSITVMPRSDDLGYNITIVFYTINATSAITFNQILYRIR